MNDQLPTVWEEAERLSLLTGIRVMGFQEPEDGPGYNEILESAYAIDPEEFTSGAVKPEGFVLLLLRVSGESELWELSSELSKIARDCGPAPGTLISLLTH